ncbi:hypothetical protein B0I37DRAFT_441917 [Chaetomium sp. MPI-CAGE-AT-0009]|nr:hypothetical protein B0I37DRAFT_441917 [Chaetomium sp. MPI-CAGE-AT-0009]
MTDSRITDPDFGTREEDWPDLDMDSDAEGYAEANERAEAAMLATINRSIQQRHAQSNHDEYDIPEALYDKARTHQDQLTEEERRLLLSRNDVIGKALAYPDSLTSDERDEILLMPPPDVVRANIQRATAGSLSTPIELHAKARDAIHRGQFETMLNDDEIALLARSFYALDDPAFSYGERMSILSDPGARRAMGLLSERLGLDAAVTGTASVCHSKRPSFMSGSDYRLRNPQPPGRLLQHGWAPNGAPIVSWSASPLIPRDICLDIVPNPPSHTDRFGTGPWPPNASLRSPFDIYSHEKRRSGPLAEYGWRILMEYEKENYRARSEALRLAAWAKDEADLAAGTSPHNPAVMQAAGVSQPHPRPPPPAPTNLHHISPPPPASQPPRAPPLPPPPPPNPPSRTDLFGAGPWPPTARPCNPMDLFGDEHDDLRGYEAHHAWGSSLTEEQREDYRARSEALRLAAWARHEAVMQVAGIGQPPVVGGARFPFGDGRERMPGVPLRPETVTGLRGFHWELGEGVGFWEAEGQWRALTAGQREGYEARARAVNVAARAAYHEGRSV